MVGLWPLDTIYRALALYMIVGYIKVGSQATLPGVPRSPSSVARETEIAITNHYFAYLFNQEVFDSRVTQFSVPRSLNDVTRESKLINLQKSSQQTFYS